MSRTKARAASSGGTLIGGRVLKKGDVLEPYDARRWDAQVVGFGRRDGVPVVKLRRHFYGRVSGPVRVATLRSVGRNFRRPE